MFDFIYVLCLENRVLLAPVAFPLVIKKKKGISKYSILTPKINTMMNSFYFCFCFWGFFIKKKKLSFPRLVLIEFKQSVKERKIKRKPYGQAVVYFHLKVPLQH